MILVVGASGATGQLLVAQLLARDLKVRVIVRNLTALAEDLRSHPNLSATEASVLELSDNELQQQVDGCQAVASCLGHNLTFKGVFGPPHRLVTNATRRLCTAIQASAQQAQESTPVKYVLMNTAGNRNLDCLEPISAKQKFVLSLLRTLLPPHADNEQAAEFLRAQIGQSHPVIEWAAVRPDNLINTPSVSDYHIHSSPIRSAIFDAGTTSRINVAHFMAELITDNALWARWQGQMPVIYNKN